MPQKMHKRAFLRQLEVSSGTKEKLWARLSLVLSSTFPRVDPNVGMPNISGVMYPALSEKVVV
jgi:hypothetical protein